MILKDPPDKNTLNFSEMLVRENGLEQTGFECWIFCPGMKFKSSEKWWGDRGLRDFPHEGIDLGLYRGSSQRIHHLHEKTRIPVIDDGVVKAVFEDYLGRAMIIEHENPLAGNEKFISIYAHTRPRDNLQMGSRVKRGDIIAHIADTGHSKSGILPHLHFSLGLASPALTYEHFTWEIIQKPDRITLLDPLKIIDGPSRELSPEDPFCQKLCSHGGPVHEPI